MNIISSITAWSERIISCCSKHWKIIIAIGVGMAIGYVFNMVGWPEFYQNQPVVEAAE
jgi:hypothetical protein|tara:strand:+ start:15 stop:188 length:174 start_codon:yes stop_codon:yes gene_type:complete